jgi:predicted dehydrogenase
VHGDRGTAVLHDDQLEYFHAADVPGGDDFGRPDVQAQPPNQAPQLVSPEELRGALKPSDSFVMGHLRQYHDVVDAIDGRQPASVRVHDALTALAVVRAIYVSATLGRPVAVNDVLDGAFDTMAVAT